VIHPAPIIGTVYFSCGVGGATFSYEPPPLLGISKRFRSTWVVNCNARRAVFRSTWDACVSTSILEDACLYPHPLSPSICAGDRRGGVESIADNDVVNLPEFAAMAAGVPMITRCDHSAEKGVGCRSPRQQRALPSAGMLATFSSKRCHARIQASLIACSWVAE
jgi:hypothetical protein